MARPIPSTRIADLPRGEHGLTADEAARRQRQYGFNDIVGRTRSGWRDLARDTARDPMIWFLIGTSGLFTLIGDTSAALILLVAMVPFIGMDAYLHRRTQASTEGLSDRLASVANVIRDGAVVEVAARELVPGDLVAVRGGESFPADGLIVAGDQIQADESALTGEALPVRKKPLAEASALPPKAESAHWALAGTRMLTGNARVRIVYTGAETLYGEIVRSALEGVRARTPLQTAIGNLVAVLLTAALIICAVLAAIRLRQGHDWIDAVLSSVTLAVAALPEEFPVVFTFFLGVGVYRLAKRQALVRRAIAVENIGRVTCICSDKTGTITEGRLVLSHCDPSRAFDTDALVRLAARAARAESGDPLDAALLAAAGSFADDSRCIASYPFTEDRRRETAVWQWADGRLMAVAKGAPETIFSIARISGQERQDWLARLSAYTATGHKVIACAVQSLTDHRWSGGEPDRGFEVAGLIAFEDPAREGVREAIQACREAGIRVLMITGDHPATATAIARDIGLGGGDPKVISLDDGIERGGGAEPWRQVDVVARAYPSHKLEIVRALQAAGEIVAVTGDGVNDVPALQAADIGIAMGERGTRSAREIAAIVLLDDNFRSIVRAIAEGRQLFRNLQLSFAYLLIIHIPLVLSAAIIPLAGYPLLYLPIHIVWLELVIHPTALLVFQELPTNDKLAPVKQHAGNRFFGALTWAGVALIGTLITAAVVFGYDYALGNGRDVEHARAMALVALIIAAATVTAGLSRLRSRTAIAVVCASLASLLALVQIPGLAALVELRPLHLDDWALSAAAGMLAGSISCLIPATLRR
jgi:Ca2+-transporting ATPase